MPRPTRIDILPYSSFLVLATLLAGCSGSPGGDVSTSADAAAPEASAPAATGGGEQLPRSGDAQPLALRGVDYAGLIQFIEDQKGRPVVLDIWSTSCDPCVRELPNLAKLYDDYRERGVVCASLNIDFTGAEGTTPDEAQARARQVLEALGVHVDNLYSLVSDKELYRTELFKTNQIYAIRAILLFDQSGTVVGRFGESGGPPYDQVRAALDSLL
jgi:thiol-disulfide isomerase/thioredoxin